MKALAKLKQALGFTQPQPLVFTSLLPGLEKFMPIVPARDARPQWLKKARQDYAARIKDNPHPTPATDRHTARCPGINDLVRTGWVVRAWQDITIEVMDGGAQIRWNTPVDQAKVCEVIGHTVEFHPPEQLHDYHVEWYDDSLPALVKIKLPWVVSIPKGYSLLQLPVPYADDKTFEAVPGVIPSDLPDRPLFIQVRWKVKDGFAMIPAGTPLAQYILVPTDQGESVVTTGSQEDYLANSSLPMAARFSRNYSEVKAFASALREDRCPFSSKENK